jgi:hypothetical protein
MNEGMLAALERHVEVELRGAQRGAQRGRGVQLSVGVRNLTDEQVAKIRAMLGPSVQVSVRQVAPKMFTLSVDVPAGMSPHVASAALFANVKSGQYPSKPIPSVRPTPKALPPAHKFSPAPTVARFDQLILVPPTRAPEGNIPLPTTSEVPLFVLPRPDPLSLDEEADRYRRGAGTAGMNVWRPKGVVVNVPVGTPYTAPPRPLNQRPAAPKKGVLSFTARASNTPVPLLNEHFNSKRHHV